MIKPTLLLAASLALVSSGPVEPLASVGDRVPCMCMGCYWDTMANPPYLYCDCHEPPLYNQWGIDCQTYEFPCGETTCQECNPNPPCDPDDLPAAIDISSVAGDGALAARADVVGEADAVEPERRTCSGELLGRTYTGEDAANLNGLARVLRF